MHCLVLLFAVASGPAFAGPQKPCVSTDQASRLLNKDVCISAHIYDVVQLSDGTRFLDVCTPETTDDACRFTVVSLPQDRKDVGELRTYRNTDVHIRGIVQPMHGRAGMLLSHARQFNGGPPKFRPNPMLVRGFDAQQENPPLFDPNLLPQGRGRAFMNRNDQQARPAR
jgi:hypothetical protein